MAKSKDSSPGPKDQPAAAAGAAKRYRILSLDGGGIRGLITAVWLDKLERTLGGRLRDHFDLIAGTSTGAILAAGIASKIPAADIITMYRTRGREIFPGAPARLLNRVKRVVTDGPSAPKYNGKGLEAVLRDVFGDQTFGSLGRRPIVLITSYNTLNREALVFKTNTDAFNDLPLWGVVKSSCSAPSYFPAHVMTVGAADVPLIDGGVVANNPTACAIAEGVRENSERKLAVSGPARPPGPDRPPVVDAEPCEIGDFVVASFGTGSLTRPIDVKDAQEWGALEWAIPIIDVLFDGAADSVDYIASYLVPAERYFRFQTSLDAAYDDMDKADEPNLNALTSVAETYLAKEGEKKIAALAKLLE